MEAEVNPYEEIIQDSENESMDEPEVVESNEGQPTEPVITKEFVERHGLTKNLIGQPYDKLGNAYSNIQKHDTKLSMQLSEMQKEIGAIKEQLSKKEAKQIEQEVEEKLPDYETEVMKFFDDDGFLVDKKGYARFNREYQEKRDKMLKKEFEKVLKAKDEEYQEKSKATNESLQKIQADKNEALLYDHINEGLTKIYKEEVSQDIIDKAIEDFQKTLDESDILIYRGNIPKIATAIVNYHKAQLFEDKFSKTDTEKAAELAHKKTIDNIKKSNKKFTEVSSSARDNTRKKGDDAYDELLEEAYHEQGWAHN